MGADGHIRIFSKEKLKEKFSKADISVFEDCVMSSVFYKQSLRGEELYTYYWGDNLSDCTDMFEMLAYVMDRKTLEFDENSYSYDRHYAESFSERSKKEQKLLVEMVDYLQDSCFITSWEVWT